MTVGTVSLVVAMARNGVIGRDGTLPWHLPDDLRHFKHLTLGKPVLMGRRTFESIGRPLPGRRNLVLSSRLASAQDAPAAAASGIEVVGSFAQACERTGSADELCVIGGAQLYALTWPAATRLHLTLVQADVPGDVVFPVSPGAAPPGSVSWPGWREIERIEHPIDARHAYAMSFITLQRC